MTAVDLFILIFGSAFWLTCIGFGIASVVDTVVRAFCGWRRGHG